MLLLAFSRDLPLFLLQSIIEVWFYPDILSNIVDLYFFLLFIQYSNFGSILYTLFSYIYTDIYHLHSEIAFCNLESCMSDWTSLSKENVFLQTVRASLVACSSTSAFTSASFWINDVTTSEKVAFIPVFCGLELPSGLTVETLLVVVPQHGFPFLHSRNKQHLLAWNAHNTSVSINKLKRSHANALSFS